MALLWAILAALSVVPVLLVKCGGIGRKSKKKNDDQKVTPVTATRVEGGTKSNSKSNSGTYQSPEPKRVTYGKSFERRSSQGLMNPTKHYVGGRGLNNRTPPQPDPKKKNLMTVVEKSKNAPFYNDKGEEVRPECDNETIAMIKDDFGAPQQVLTLKPGAREEESGTEASKQQRGADDDEEEEERPKKNGKKKSRANKKKGKRGSKDKKKKKKKRSKKRRDEDSDEDEEEEEGGGRKRSERNIDVTKPLDESAKEKTRGEKKEKPVEEKTEHTQTGSGAAPSQ